jgi:hypothetical protein
MFASGEKQPWAEPAPTNNDTTSSWTPNETPKRMKNKKTFFNNFKI